jgi:transaldolase
MTQLTDLSDLGQSIWIDFIRRSYMTSGDLQKDILDGVRGMTSNPTIFEKAIAHSSDYDASLTELAAGGLPAAQIYEQLALADIRMAADLFRPVFERAGGADGFVSLEVSPLLANDTSTTLSEAKRLWAAVERPNLMVKIPATRAGLPAIRAAIAAGININVTLIFSLERYAEVMEAYLSGLEDRLAAGGALNGIHSVASFFVSRLDTKVDRLLQAIGEAGKPWLGKAALANSRLAYQSFEKVFGSDRFMRLKAHGANLQRPLWASTGTKNPAYSDILYVQELIGPHTVNTLPPETLTAFNDHGQVRRTIDNDLQLARETMQALASLKIDLGQVTDELETEGVASFSKSFDSLMNSLEAKRLTVAHS